MNLLELKRVVDEAVKYAGDCAKFVEVEISFKNRCYEVRRVSQFGVIPSVVIEIGEKTFVANEL